ncbi:DNA repair endonuclease [Schizosaccharomyces japonicus yFS275]|uniref:DNA repair endonuclease n=1 Tax=Schizosaccharomyces japonicus (strain yFS275 / FY16936) TaxID=402676 RepID=B6K166_SCHJY|nr:DNA repair endonuclease [Schizosaccharomyces japonicus yFS275]EEB07687.1 DNA repair endonuclease [Schizosaccharomyces japonicus yFS275]
MAVEEKDNERCSDHATAAALTAKQQTWCSEQIRLERLVEEDGDVQESVVNECRIIAGLDISFKKSSEEAAAAIVLWDSHTQKVVWRSAIWIDRMEEPYIPGFLSFREAKWYRTLLNSIPQDVPQPEVIIVDGNGRLHPVLFGLACHIGVMTNKPTIGVAKNYFCAPSLNEDLKAHRVHIQQHLSTMGPQHPMPLRALPEIGYGDKPIGMAVWTSPHATRPVYVSIGHKISLPAAVAVVTLCSGIHSRVPEPVRLADIYAKEVIAKRNL